MSIGNEMPFRRSARGKDATGSLVFDAERRRAKGKDTGGRTSKIDKRAAEKAHIG